MNSNDIIKQVYAAVVAKAKTQCAAEESAQRAIGIGNDVIDIGKTWTESFSNDGKIDDAEEQKMNDTFAEKLDKYVPNKSGIVVTIVWEGMTIPFINLGWRGLKYYFNKWFDLGLK